MAYVLTDGSTGVVTYPYNIGLLRRDNPNVSFPANPAESLLAVWNVFPVTDTTRPSIDTLTQYLTEDNPTFVTDHWEQVWVINTYTAAEQSSVLTGFQQNATAEAAARFEVTNKYITQSLTEGLELSSELIAYRTALMDPSLLPGYPNNIVWPTEPTTYFVGAGPTKVASIEVGTVTVTGSMVLGTTPITNDSVTNKEYVDNAIADLVNSSPSTLNTLNELAAALGNDDNFATTVATQLSLKANTDDVNLVLALKANTAYVDSSLSTKLSLAGGTMSGDINMASNKITNLPDPTQDQDVAHKKYVDDSVNVSGEALIAVFEGALV